MRTEIYDEHLDCALDEALKSTFPASDPVTISACHTPPAKAATQPPKPRKVERRAGGTKL